MAERGWNDQGCLELAKSRRDSWRRQEESDLKALVAESLQSVARTSVTDGALLARCQDGSGEPGPSRSIGLSMSRSSWGAAMTCTSSSRARNSSRAPISPEAFISRSNHATRQQRRHTDRSGIAAGRCIARMRQPGIAQGTQVRRIEIRLIGQQIQGLRRSPHQARPGHSATRRTSRDPHQRR